MIPSEIDKIIRLNPYTGYILALIFVILFLLDKLSDSIASLTTIKSKILIPLANNLQFKFLQRAAIKSDIQGKINQKISVISNELLNEKLKPLEIEWVKNSSVEDFIQEGKILVRLRPLKNQNENLLNVTEPYLESILIPKSKSRLQQVQRKAIVHFTTQVIIADSESLLEKFYQNYYLPDCQKNKSLPEYFKKMEFIYKRGLFFSVAITSLESATDKNKFIKVDLGSEFYQILDHLIQFIENLNKLDRSKNNIMWEYRTSDISYSLLLVAQPFKAVSGDVSPYLKRAKEDLKNTNLLFIAFSHQERVFGYKVTSELEKYKEVIFLEELHSQFDYRGAKDGIVRIYKTNNKK